MKRERLGRNLVIANGTVKCLIKRQGKFHEWTAPVQGTTAYSIQKDGTKKPTARLLKWLDEVEAAIEEKRFDALKQTHIRQSGITIGAILKAYSEAAETRHALYGHPEPRSRGLVVGRFRQLVKGCGLADGDQLDRMTPDAVQGWIEKRVMEKTSSTRPREMALSTAAAVVKGARNVFARWALDHYRRNKIEVPECVLLWPAPKPSHPQWQDPPKELKERTLVEGEKLRKADPATWILYHVLLSFGCRPVDALGLTRDNFLMMPGADGEARRCLVYTPRKTRNSSGKQVVIPVPERVWDALEAARSDAGCAADIFVVPSVPGKRGRATVLQNLNTWMRSIGWARPFFYQGAYVLRKLFTSAVLVEHGEQIASDFCGSSVSMVRRSYGAFFHERLPTVDVSAVLRGRE